MPVTMISYRRADSKDTTRRICDELVTRYGKKSVYIDIDSIQPSADYRVHITQTLERALVMLAVIGTEWSGPRVDGNPRIFDAEDPVRAEVETAFANRRAVLPVLVNGAVMPTEADLPGSLKLLPYLNALVVRSGDEFASDIERLSRAIDHLALQFWTLFISTYLALPFALLLFSQYLILFKIDTDPLYLRLAVTAISAALGIGLCFHIGFRTVATLTTGAAMGLVSAIGMVAINTAFSNPSAPFDIWKIFPSVTRDWQEVIEYFALIAVVTLGSNVLGWAFRDTRSRVR
jgi:hypothetical protein